MYEQNKRTPPAETLNRIAKYFNTTIDYLMNGTSTASQSSKIVDLKKADILSYDGKPISDEELEIIKAILSRHGINKN